MELRRRLRGCNRTRHSSDRRHLQVLLRSSRAQFGCCSIAIPRCWRLEETKIGMVEIWIIVNLTMKSNCCATQMLFFPSQHSRRELTKASLSINLVLLCTRSRLIARHIKANLTDTVHRDCLLSKEFRSPSFAVYWDFSLSAWKLPIWVILFCMLPSRKYCVVCKSSKTKFEKDMHKVNICTKLYQIHV